MTTVTMPDTSVLMDELRAALAVEQQAIQEVSNLSASLNEARQRREIARENVVRANEAVIQACKPEGYDELAHEAFIRNLL